MRQIVWTCIVAWLAGCDIPPEVKAEMACTTICNCFAPPFAVEQCISDCIEEGDLGLIPEDCFECIQAHANTCSTLEPDCEPICEGEMPPPPEPVPDGGL